MMKRSARPARDGRRLLMTLVLVVAALTLVVFVSACGGDDNGDNGAKTDSSKMERADDEMDGEGMMDGGMSGDEMLASMSDEDKEHEASEPADEHFADALDELDKGDMEMVTHHLVGAVLSCEKHKLSKAKKEAEEALDAADEADMDALKKHIKAGLKAAR